MIVNRPDKIVHGLPARVKEILQTSATIPDFFT